MRLRTTLTTLLLATSGVLGLAACGKQTSAVAANPDQASPAAASSAPAGGYGPGSSGQGYAAGDARAAPVPTVNGKPMWAANRKHSAEENAQYQFGKNGKDFAARDEFGLCAQGA